ncbi:MAG: NapC/NirT family cytochrome c, partial [Phycisphaerae bacterium]
LIGWLFAYEPVTRNLVATEWVCSYCHLEREYNPTARLSFSKPHPATPKAGEEVARCVDCHLPEGFWATTFAYTHFASATDLFGHFRDRASERAGDWIPMSAARAYRMRDRLFESNSVTCRTCHIESEIKPKRKRGQKAHAKALENKETCIECHDNLVHRYVEVRKNAFQKPKSATE